MKLFKCQRDFDRVSALNINYDSWSSLNALIYRRGIRDPLSHVWRPVVSHEEVDTLIIWLFHLLQWLFADSGPRVNLLLAGQFVCRMLSWIWFDLIWSLFLNFEFKWKSKGAFCLLTLFRLCSYLNSVEFSLSGWLSHQLLRSSLLLI